MRKYEEVFFIEASEELGVSKEKLKSIATEIALSSKE